MIIKTSFKLGKISNQGFRHFPFLYFAYGRNGFVVCVIGLSVTIKF